MPAARVSTDWQPRVARVREQLAASGTNVSEWARERGFTPKLVSEVLAGNRPCLRGQSHRIAVALGLKQAAPAPAPIRVSTGLAADHDGARR